MMLHSESYFAKTLARLRAVECDGGGQQRHFGLVQGSRGSRSRSHIQVWVKLTFHIVLAVASPGSMGNQALTTHGATVWVEKMPKK